MMPARASRILGVNTRTYPAQNHGYTERGCTIRVVLVAGRVGDYAAYAGRGTPEWVARHGAKLAFEEACLHFPAGQLTREHYRWP